MKLLVIQFSSLLSHHEFVPINTIYSTTLNPYICPGVTKIYKCNMSVCNLLLGTQATERRLVGYRLEMLGMVAETRLSHLS
jgi:hypothetical protein